MIPIRSFSQVFAVAAIVASGLSAQENTGNAGNRPMPVAPRMQPSPAATAESPNYPRGLTAHPFHTHHTKSIILMPPAMERCTLVPTELTWKHRDVIREIQRMARQGFIPVTPVSGLVDTWQDNPIFPAGWKAYGFVVPAKGELEVTLSHGNLGWFRLMMVNKWGQLQEGMLQNLIPKGYPVVTFKNPKNSPQEVFVIADDPGWMSSKTDPYTMVVKRSWDNKKDGADPMPQTVGIWAKNSTVGPRLDPSQRMPTGLR